MESALDLYGYERKWMEDPARFLAGMWARQTGKSWSTAGKIVLECREFENSKWITVSSGERQVKEFMERVKFHGEVTGMAMSWAEESYGYQHPDGYRDEYKVLETSFRNGSKIIGIPANPDTARGYTGNVYLDEFSVHKNSREMWAAVFPVVSRMGLRLIVTFTPKGKQNKAYEIWNNPVFVRHKVDIHEAVAQGCPHNIEELKAAIDDPDLWAQEYELVFLDEATAFLTYDMINEVETDTAGDPAQKQQGPFYVGMDIGRRRDLTVIFVLEELGDTLWTRETIEMQRASFAAQDRELERIIREYNPVRVCMDQTGMGEKPVEDAQRMHGTSRVEGVLFTGPVKLDLANALRRKFEDRLIRIPVNRKLRDDLHSVKKLTTAAGNIRFDAERSEDSHADRFWALALAIHAAGNTGIGISVGNDPDEMATMTRHRPGMFAAAGGMFGRFRKAA
jgi:phage FluMu gp28-like protein